MLIPLRIETLFKHYPVTNWLIILVTVICFGLEIGGGWSEDTIRMLILHDWSWSGLLGYVLLHVGLLHLIGNMLFLWVFGNAICGNTSNWLYPFLYAGFGVVAGAVHLLYSDESVVGASGAINGVVGMAVAMYPQNDVTVGLFFFRLWKFQMPLWRLSLIWLGFDIWGAAAGSGRVAYWAHIGGFVCGVITGIMALRMGWVTLTRYDNRSLEEIIGGKTAEERVRQIRIAEREEMQRRLLDEQESESQVGEPREEAIRVEESVDVSVFRLTLSSLENWSSIVPEIPISESEAAVINEGGHLGVRKRFEIYYGKSFLELGHSFHRSLADYYQRVARGHFYPHERDALCVFLRMVEEDFPAMQACGFVDATLTSIRDERALAAFLA